MFTLFQLSRIEQFFLSHIIISIMITIVIPIILIIITLLTLYASIIIIRTVIIPFVIIIIIIIIIIIVIIINTFIVIVTLITVPRWRTHVRKDRKARLKDRLDLLEKMFACWCLFVPLQRTRRELGNAVESKYSSVAHNFKVTGEREKERKRKRKRRRRRRELQGGDRERGIKRGSEKQSVCM